MISNLPFLSESELGKSCFELLHGTHLSNLAEVLSSRDRGTYVAHLNFLSKLSKVYSLAWAKSKKIKT